MKKPPLISKNRARLASVLQTAGKLISIEDVSNVLELERHDAAKMLSRWTQQGWLARIGPGLYASIPMDALTSEQLIEDPWILIPTLFSPCYIGGWTAANHWDLTEQIFRSIFVFTARPVRIKAQLYHGTNFVLKHTKENTFFGLKTIWRDGTKLSISDKHRTLIDMLDTPQTGGGIVHVFDCFKAYFKDQEADTVQLVEYASRLNNGAIFKRMGFLAEQIGIQELIKPCHERLTAGNAKLDPTASNSRLIKRWNLWVPKNERDFYD